MKILTKSTPEKPSLKMTDTVYSALELMKRVNASGVIVLNEDNTVAGVFTAKDYLNKMVLTDLPSKETQLGEVMNKDIVGVTPGSKLRPLVSLLAKHRVVPLMDGHKNPLGIMTPLTMLEYLHSLPLM